MLIGLIIVFYFVFVDKAVAPTVDGLNKVPTNKRACESQDGQWGIVGLSAFPVCNLPTADGGKSCTDGSQCESRKCLANESTISADTNAAVTGQCSAWQMMAGCLLFVEDGKASRICID